MSVQLSFGESAKGYIADVGENECLPLGLQSKSNWGASRESGRMLSLVHLDVSIAVASAARGPSGAIDSCAVRSRSLGQLGGTPLLSISSKSLGELDEDAVRCSEVTGTEDPIMRTLSEALEAMEAANGSYSAVCADALRLAIVTRHFSQQVATSMPLADLRQRPSGRPTKSLQKWRLKRVLEYVDNHLAEKISLQDLAAVAGLSRMHFAAQFRMATGLRPHQYILKQRIEYSKELLKQTKESLVGIALTVGFQTQAHFTTVFKSLTGDTPYQWRCERQAQPMRNAASTQLS